MMAYVFLFFAAVLAGAGEPMYRWYQYWNEQRKFNKSQNVDKD